MARSRPGAARRTPIRRRGSPARNPRSPRESRIPDAPRRPSSPAARGRSRGPGRDSSARQAKRPGGTPRRRCARAERRGRRRSKPQWWSASQAPRRAGDAADDFAAICDQEPSRSSESCHVKPLPRCPLTCGICRTESRPALLAQRQRERRAERAARAGGDRVPRRPHNRAEGVEGEALPLEFARGSAPSTVPPRPRSWRRRCAERFALDGGEHARRLLLRP